jgi:ribonuclease D
MHLILNTTQELEEYLKTVNESKIIFLDTEFKRRDTYFPILSLLQLSINGKIAIVDPLSKFCKLDPLVKILLDKSIIKVLHSARQDLEILYSYTQNKPIKPIFDTQIAAAFCGYGISVSYEFLVQDLLKVNLDKSQRVTDWAHRPLTKDQIQYALCDVLYLPAIYAKLLELTESNKTFQYCLEECTVLESSNFLKTTTRKLISKLRFESKDASQVAKLIRLVNWRETLAQKLNINRGQILQDSEIHLLTSKISNTSIFDKYDNIMANEIQNILKTKLSENELMVAQGIIKDKFMRSFKLNRNLCRIVIQIIADHLSIASELIANAQDIDIFAISNKASGENCQSKLFTGWRYEIAGRCLEDFFAGKIFIRIDDSKSYLVEKPS